MAQKRKKKEIKELVEAPGRKIRRKLITET